MTISESRAFLNHKLSFWGKGGSFWWSPRKRSLQSNDLILTNAEQKTFPSPGCFMHLCGNWKVL